MQWAPPLHLTPVTSSGCPHPQDRCPAFLSTFPLYIIFLELLQKCTISWYHKLVPQKYHNLVAENNRNLVSHSSRGQTSKVKLSAGLLPLGAEGQHVPWVSGDRQQPMALLSLEVNHALRLCLHGPPPCVSLSSRALLIRTPVVE